MGKNLETLKKSKDRTIEKTLKVLEIIKKKGLSISDIAHITNGHSWESYVECETTQAQYWGYEDKLDKELKTKEEYDLLKEVFQLVDNQMS